MVRVEREGRRHVTGRRAILLAGGRGTRLYPLSAVQSKQLAPVYDKPMIYYALTTIMLSGIREVLVISTPNDIDRFEALLGDGSQWAIKIGYAVQSEPRGIAEALIIPREFLDGRQSLLMLGDNLFYGRLDFLRDAAASTIDEATIFAYQVSDPSGYGVVEFGNDGRALRIEEKPSNPRSRWAVPGLYLYPSDASDIATRLAPSARGELEITDLNSRYLEQGRLKVRIMGRGIAWFDTGTPKALLGASNFIEAVESRQGLIVGSPEEVAYRLGYIDRATLKSTAMDLPESAYRDYLLQISEEVSLYATASSISTIDPEAVSVP